MKSKKLHRIFFFLILTILILPSIQGFSHIFKVKKLKGYFIETKKDSLKIDSWFNGSYQDNITKYSNEKFGFRPFFVRLHNQLNYSLYDEVNAAGVIVGKENYLYEENYIRAYNGTDFLGKDSIDRKLEKLAVINDSLKKNDVDLIVAFAAGKGTFYPEYFPEKDQNKKAEITNQSYFRSKLNQYNISYIDYNTWFKQAKDTSKYLLYPKYGIHWSYYGMVKAADSLIRYIEDLREIDLPNIEITDIKLSKKLKFTDYDIGEALNLLFQPSTEAMAYPKFRWAADSTSVKPKVVVISDSFYWGLYNMGLATNSFDTGGFWYYFEHAYPENKPVKEFNLREKILEQDVIVLLGTEATFNRFPYGFIEQTYSMFTKQN